MLMHVSCRILALVLFVAAFAPNPGLAAKATECTKIPVCYCVNEDLKGLIDAKVVHFREVLTAERNAGKAVGYMSVPLSTIGGGFFNVNMEVAAAAKAHIEKRFGTAQVWILNRGVPEANIPSGSGADYMLMWTQNSRGQGRFGRGFRFRVLRWAKGFCPLLRARW